MQCPEVKGQTTIYKTQPNKCDDGPIVAKMKSLAKEIKLIYTAIVLFEQSTCVDRILTSDKRSLTAMSHMMHGMWFQMMSKYFVLGATVLLVW